MLFFKYEQYTTLVYVLSGIIFIIYLLLCLRKESWLLSFGYRAHLRRFSRIPKIHRNILRGLSISIASCILGLVVLQPKWQTTLDKPQKEAVEITFVLDVSISMLAEDVKPNRLQRAKMEIANLVRTLEEDRVGLVVFAARAFSLLPYPTTDYDGVFLRILDMVNERYVRFVPYGTNIGNALILAMDTFTMEKTKKIMIFLTDGEENIVTRSQVAEAVKLLLERKDISIYVIGIGDPEKASPIPRKDENGKVIGYEISEKGEIIHTKPNPLLLRTIAEMVGGTYQHSATGEELKHIFSRVIEKHKSIVGVKKQNIIKDIYQYFLGGALALLALYFIL